VTLKGKGKVFHALAKHYATKAYWEVEV